MGLRAYFSNPISCPPALVRTYSLPFPTQTAPFPLRPQPQITLPPSSLTTDLASSFPSHKRGSNIRLPLLSHSAPLLSAPQKAQRQHQCSCRHQTSYFHICVFLPTSMLALTETFYHIYDFVYYFLNLSFISSSCKAFNVLKMKLEVGR